MLSDYRSWKRQVPESATGLCFLYRYLATLNYPRMIPINQTIFSSVLKAGARERFFSWGSKNVDMPSDCQNLGGGGISISIPLRQKVGGAIAPLAPPPAPAPLSKGIPRLKWLHHCIYNTYFESFHFREVSSKLGRKLKPASLEYNYKNKTQSEF